MESPVIIASTQIKDFFRAQSRQGSRREFLARMEVLARNFRTLSPLETGLGVLALALILFFARYVKKSARLHRGALRRDGDRRPFQASGGNDRHAIRSGNSLRLAQVASAAISF